MWPIVLAVVVVIVSLALVIWAWRVRLATFRFAAVHSHVLYRHGNRSLREFRTATRRCNAKTVVMLADDDETTREPSKSAMDFCREQGIDVYGIGQQKTPEAFRQACTRFIFTENFVAGEAGEAAAKPALRPVAEAAELIRKALDQMEEDGEGWFHLGAVGQRMQNLSPEFDTRTFGQSKLSDLVEATGRYEIDRSKGVRLRPRKKVRGRSGPKAG